MLTKYKRYKIKAMVIKGTFFLIIIIVNIIEAYLLL